MTVRTRIAPSPTGEMHIGTAAIALKNYAFARKHGGQFIIRIEDTDQEREVAGATERLLETLKKFDLNWDEGPDIGGPYAPYTQSERLELYQKYAKELVDKDKAYYCFCSKDRLEKVRADQMENHQQPRYDRFCRALSSTEVAKKLDAGESSVIRLKVPDDQEIAFEDLVRGTIVFQSNEVDDQVLLKSDGFPTYHLGVVVDDYLMKITHILRGEEWISSTPKHVLLYQAFGWDQPVYAHMPVFLNPDGKGKMSKRKGTVSAELFLSQGYLPEALLNFFMILGWAPKDQREMLTVEEYIQEFDPKDMSMKSVVFDMKKLDWMNGLYIRKLSMEDLKHRLQNGFIPADFPAEKIDAVLPLIADRLERLSDFAQFTPFFYQPITVDPQLLVKKSTPTELKDQLNGTSEGLAKLIEWSVPQIEVVIRGLQKSKNWKKSQYFMMLRIAVTGQTATPPLFETMEVIGKEEVLNRFAAAIRIIPDPLKQLLENKLSE